MTDSDMSGLMRFYDQGSKSNGFEAGIEMALRATLASPKFVFRVERDPAGITAGGSYTLSDLELASRLSFFLWSQGPDDALLKIAADGKLNRPEVLEAQARRMLADSRASSLVRNFALKWLNVDNLNEVQPDPLLFPAFNDQLRRDLAVEIESFVSSVLLQDRNVNELLTTNHTFLNERLTQHYNITSIINPQFQHVELQDPQH